MNNTVWTPEQESAIVNRGCNLLVSAAAGSGKTAVLVERIIRRILDDNDPVDVDRLLVVTFTKAAASEMRERIGRAIAKELNKNPTSRHLNRQLTLLNRATVTTLHSFCLEVLRQFFYRLDLDPGFRVADDHEAVLLRQEVLDELFEDKYFSGEDSFLALVDSYGGIRDDLYLQDMVLKLDEFASSHPWPADWLNNAVSLYLTGDHTTLESHPWGQCLLSWLQLDFEGARDKLIRACGLASGPGGPAVYLDTLADDLRLIEDLIRAVGISWPELYNVINNSEFASLKPCRDKSVDENLKEGVRKIREQVKKSIGRIKDNFFSRPPEDILADLKKVYPLAESLIRLTTEFRDRYNAAKREKAILDFSDLEHYCLQILLDDASAPGKPVPSQVACDLRAHFAEVLVDEYQDINEVQETILSLVARDATNQPNRFMVGDVKQSIYRFRLAEPALFMAKYLLYPREIGGPELGIDLSRNFRSRREIIEPVNYIFRQLMTPRIGEMAYDEKAELVAGADYPMAVGGIVTATGPVEFYLLEKNQQDAALEDNGDNEDAPDNILSDSISPSDESAELDTIQKEARLVAKRIRRMVEGTDDDGTPEFYIYDRQEGYRPVRYRDIVVLLRTTSGVANIFMEEFRHYGIPAYADLNTGYFAATEVETMMSLLKIIDNPRQDIPLAAVLRSPVVGITSEDLAQIRQHDFQGDFYDALVKFAAETENNVSLAVRSFLQSLEEWRSFARRETLSDLIWRLYNDTGYYAYVGSMPGGSQRQANLRALYDRARQYEATSFRGLFRFLRFVEKFQDSGNDLGSARALGEKEDVVRIISIHKSKGLEFPVVIVAGLGKQFNASDLYNRILLHKKLGVGLPVVETQFPLTYPTIAQHAIRKQMQMEMLSEEMRILYVALTRAREKLILVGSQRDLAKSAVDWCLCINHNQWSLSDSDLAGAKSFLDWLGPAIARHPDGEPIRKLAKAEQELSGPTTKDPSRWEVHIPDPTSLLILPESNSFDPTEMLEQVRSLRPVKTSGTYREAFAEMLNWRYPHQYLVGLAAKASVTEIKGHFTDEFAREEIPSYLEKIHFRRESFSRPAFLLHKTSLSPAETGTAVHLLMQHINPALALTLEDIRSEVHRMISAELLTKEQADAIDISSVLAFFHTEPGQKITSGATIRREVPFTMTIPANRIYDGLPDSCSEKVLIQGVIDCLIEEGDGYILLDYKTDNLSLQQLPEAAERYRGQLNLYAMAVENILHKPVIEKYLYFFSQNQAWKL